MIISQKIVFVSGKGGVGKSSCCVAIGKELSNRNKKVLLLDFDIGLRSLDALLNVSDKVLYDWGDVINCRCTLNDPIINLGLLDLISCPLEDDEKYNKKNISLLIKKYDKKYDYILIDCSAGLDYNFIRTSSVADSVLVVATPDKVSVRSAGITAQKLFDNGIDDVKLIINRFKKKSIVSGKMLNIDKVIDETTVQLLGVVPEDENITYGLIQSDRNSVSFAAVQRIVNRILKKNEPLKLNF